MVRIESLSRSLILLCLGAATLIPVQPQAAVSMPASVKASTTDAKPASPLPAIGEPGKLMAIDAPSSVSPTSQTQLVIKLSERRVYLYKGKQQKARYPIAIGKPGWETPPGTFKVMEMERAPAWEHPLTGKIIPPGADNPLGLRWIGFWTDGSNLIGFHGTPNEESVGKAVSHGCVRMRNKDIAALFEQVAVGTPVIVQP